MKKTKKEIWKDIPGFENRYQVSTFGRLRSVIKKTRNGLTGKRILNLDSSTPYLRKVLIDSSNARKRFPVHRLVAMTFIPNPENKRAVNHINLDKRDNRVENLEWCTNSENIEHAYKHKRIRRDKENNSMAKLDQAKIEKIRQLRKNGMMGKDIAKLFHVSQSTVSQIVNFKIW